MFAPILLTLFYVASTLSVSVKLGPCKKGDDECLTKSMNHAHRIVYGGMSSLGIERLDPMFQENIEGDLSILKYIFTNTTVRGFKDCICKNVHLDLDALKISYTLECPIFSMAGTYEVIGKLSSMALQGYGPYEIVSSGYSISIEANLIIINGKNGKKYLQVNNFEIKPEALGPIKFDFKNLFNGQQDLEDTVLEYAHENWKDVSNYIQDPIFKENMNKIYNNYNKFLKTQPLDDIFPN